MTAPAVRPGDPVTLEITGFADGPDAVARLGELVVFVFGALPGETVRATITSVERRFARANLDAVLAASPARVEPRCPWFGTCGGCDLQHATHATQTDGKVARLRRHLERTAADPAVVRPILAPREPWAQRTTVVLHARDGTLGFLRRNSRDLVPVVECPAADPRAIALATRTWATCAGTGTAPLVTQVTARVAASTGETQVLIAATRMDPGFASVAPALGATCVAIDTGAAVTRLHGPERIREVIDDVELHISPHAFFQTSAFGARALLDTVRRLAGPQLDRSIVDLYCGGGLLALGLAAGARDVLGVEGNATAVQDARAAATAAAVGNVRFLAGDVGAWVADALVRPDLVVLDPPRSGCADGVAAAVARLGAKRIVYVACDLHALGRDVGALQANGYAVTAAQPIDMFVHTHHLEVVVALDRINGAR